MPQDTMTSLERLEAVVALKECDRTPVGFPLSWFAGRHAGITMEKFATDLEANVGAVYKTFQDLGSIDMVTLFLSPIGAGLAMPIKQKIPGRDLPPDSIIQYHEEEKYCKKLIDNIGKDSGFILSCGCDLPVDAKFENVKAMVDTAKNYPPPR
jgi:hypothetical protein